MKLHKVREQLDANNANLAGSRFDDVNLQKAIFTNVNLSEVTFSNVNMTRASIENVNLSHLTIDGVPVSELFAAHRSRTGAVLFAKNLAVVREFYQAVLGLNAEHADQEHVVLGSPAVRLVVHQIPEHIAAKIDASPQRQRADAAIKLFFEVASIAAARDLARQHGGEIFPPELEWDYQGSRVCDGTDPEGNVMQFIEAPRR